VSVAGSGDRGTAVGGYVDALCGKCRETTSHIVIAKIGSKPTRVECRTCHATHQYRVAGGTAATRARASIGSGVRKKATAAAAPNPEDIWMRAMRGASGPAVPYASSRRFEPGQRLAHPTFGEGVVSRVASPTVCEVVFNTGTRKLLMGS
jgi:hypothetical protein